MRMYVDIWYGIPACVCTYIPTYITEQAYAADVESQFYSLLAVYFFAEYCNVEVLE